VSKQSQSHRKKTVVVCPANELPAEVSLDESLRMESCSRWPHVGECTQACIPQVQFSPESLEDFAAAHMGEQCVGCGTVLTREDWYNSRLGAVQPTGGSPATGPQTIIAAQAKKSPLCSACYSASQT
jgi:hypothetical protein